MYRVIDSVSWKVLTNSYLSWLTMLYLELQKSGGFIFVHQKSSFPMHLPNLFQMFSPLPNQLFRFSIASPVVS